VIRHVALMGFMASGKSTIGQKLARRLGVAFYDLDDLIAAEHGAIAEIFYGQGEDRFRAYELQTLERVLADGAPGIIALGGGATTHEPTDKLLKKRTYRVFVKVTPEQAAARLRRSQRVRPLLGLSPSLHRIKELYAHRLPYYAHADLVVEAETLTPAQVVDRITQWMHRKKLNL